MREIKFRAWDCDNEIMSEVFTLDEANKTMYSLGQIPMQYTGLKDKNGVEIYEGDIMKVNERGEVFQVSFKVDIVTPAFVMGAKSLPISGEVIGNVYQTPELLTNN